MTSKGVKRDTTSYSKATSIRTRIETGIPQQKTLLA